MLLLPGVTLTMNGWRGRLHYVVYLRGGQGRQRLWVPGFGRSATALPSTFRALSWPVCWFQGLSPHRHFESQKHENLTSSVLHETGSYVFQPSAFFVAGVLEPQRGYLWLLWLFASGDSFHAIGFSQNESMWMKGKCRCYRFNVSKNTFKKQSKQLHLFGAFMAGKK